MRTSPFLSCAAGLLLVGCGEKSKKPAQPTNAPASSALTAPVDYLGAVARGQQSAVKTIDVTSVNKAIEMFNVQEGRYPKDLNELVEKKYLPEIPKPPYGTKIVYDANLGTVKLEKQ